jgi:hypothetical protein
MHLIEKGRLLMNTLKMLGLSFGLVAPLFAQTGSMNRSISVPPAGGQLSLRPTTLSNPRTLLELIRAATVIIDGSILSSLPAATPGSGIGNIPVIETDSVVGVNSILKGTMKDDAANIILAQIGGNSGTWQEQTEGDPLVSKGERYILFLTPDDRKNVVNAGNLPIYDIVGIWAGKVKVVNNAITFEHPASPQLHDFDGMTVDVFMAKLRATIARPFTDQDATLPINPAPAGH